MPDLTLPNLAHRSAPASATRRTGLRWQARYDDPTGRERTSLHRTRPEAEREGAKLAGSWLDPDAGVVTVGSFALDTWLPAQAIISRSEAEYRGVLRRYLLPE